MAVKDLFSFYNITYLCKHFAFTDIHKPGFPLLSETRESDVLTKTTGRGSGRGQK